MIIEKAPPGGDAVCVCDNCEKTINRAAETVPHLRGGLHFCSVDCAVASEKEDKVTPELVDSKPGGSFEQIGQTIGALVDTKNRAYGDSFRQCGRFLELLYPDGIKKEQYGDMLCLVRMFDKMKRIATDKDAFGESPFRDLCGYAILGVASAEQGKGK